MQAKANQMRTRARELQTRSGLLEEENAAFRSNIETLTLEAAAADGRTRTEKGALQAKIAALEMDISTLRAKEEHAVAPHMLRDLQSKTGEMQTAVDRLTSQRDGLKQQLSDVMTRCHAAEAKATAAAVAAAAASPPTPLLPVAVQHASGRQSLLTVRRDARGAGAEPEDQTATLTSLVETNHKLTTNIDYLFKRTKKLERELEKSKSDKYMHTEKTHTVVREPAKIYMLRRSQTGAAVQRGLIDVTNTNNINPDYSLVEARSADAPPQDRSYRPVAMPAHGSGSSSSSRRYRSEHI
jgi:outer membrane murein-binding lipoprotein Lpp